MDRELQVSLLRSLGVALASSILATSLGFGSGYRLARRLGKGTDLLLATWSVPALTPFILYGFAAVPFFKAIDLDRSLAAVVVAHTVVFSPLATALFFQRVRRLDSDLEDAARELGASEIRVQAGIVLGQAWRTAVGSAAMIFVLSWDEYVIAWFVTGFQKTYPIQIRNMVESTLSPEIYAIGCMVGFACSILVLTSFFFLRREPSES